MKNTKKIIPALAMLIVSALMLTTASFAWFAMNSKVEANGMSVSLQSNSAFLLIGTVDNAETIQNNKKTDATSSAVSPLDGTTLYPVAHETFTAETAAETEIETGNKWYTMQASNLESATGNSESKTMLGNTATNLKNYVVKYTYYVVMTADSAAGTNLSLSTADGDFSVTPGDTGDSKTAEPVCVVIACGNNVVEMKHNGTGWAAVDGAVKLADTVANDATTEINVYVYYDGNHEDVYTNNLANLTSATIKFKLTVE